VPAPSAYSKEEVFAKEKLKGKCSFGDTWENIGSGIKDKNIIPERKNNSPSPTHYFPDDQLLRRNCKSITIKGKFPRQDEIQALKKNNPSPSAYKINEELVRD